MVNVSITDEKGSIRVFQVLLEKEIRELTEEQKKAW